MMEFVERYELIIVPKELNSMIFIPDSIQLII